MGFVVPQGRERMMGYGRFEDVVNALEGAVLQGEYLVGDSSTTHWRRSKPNRQLLRPKRDELNALDFDTSRHYPPPAVPRPRGSLRTLHAKGASKGLHRSPSISTKLPRVGLWV